MDMEGNFQYGRHGGDDKEPTKGNLTQAAAAYMNSGGDGEAYGEEEEEEGYGDELGKD